MQWSRLIPLCGAITVVLAVDRISAAGTTESLLPSNFTWSVLLGLVGVSLFYDQYRFRSKKGPLPGPNWVPPLIGKFYDSVNPDFEKYKQQWASGKLSATTVFQKFIVIASTAEISRKIFNTPGSIVPLAVPSMRDILLPENFIFYQGEAHFAFRKRLNPLFTRKALSIYLPSQEAIYRRYITEWIKKGTSFSEFYTPSRDLVIEVSLRVFCGDYIPEATVKKISDSYYLITRALELVNFPIPLPGTKVYAAIQCRKTIVKAFVDCYNLSVARMTTGAEPDCLLDYWMPNMEAEKRAHQEDPTSGKYVEMTGHDVALTLLAFLFASQDAANSSMVWAMVLLEQHKDVLEKVRAEQKAVRPNNEPLTVESLDQMTYSKQVVKEVLRYRPPVIMVPHEVAKPVSLTDDYVIPQGTVIVPSVWPAAHDPEAFAQPDKFDPDRFSPERQEDVKSPKNWLIFGHGPHACIGKEYALTNLLAFLALACTEAEWDRQRTEVSDKIKIIATIFPEDDALLRFRKRVTV